MRRRRGHRHRETKDPSFCRDLTIWALVDFLTGAGASQTRYTEPRQIEKLVPQPQLAVAFGLLILKAWPIRSSTKSISEPLM